jgi:hypothetical protein
MPTLDVKVKRFIVQALACFDTPTQVAAAVKEEFGLALIRQQIAAYDPQRAQGKNLSKDLRALFETTRKTFVDDVEAIPIARQAYRLRVLNRMTQQAEASGNRPLVAQLMEQAAKEVGGAYTNTRKLEGGDPNKPIQHKHEVKNLTDDDLARIAASSSG